jgi:peptide deformylase
MQISKGKPMAIRKIAKMGHPVLRQKASIIPPKKILSEEIQSLINDMLETVIDADGRGLAAPQIHESKRLVLIEIDELEDFQVWINPVITLLTEDCILTFEGCLSIPNLRGAVIRPSKVKVEALNEKGKPISLILEDFSAIVAQHECDHLDGTLYIDKVEVETLSYLDEYKKYSNYYLEDTSEEE